MHNIHYPSTTAKFHSCSLHNNSSTIKSCVQPIRSNVYANTRKCYTMVFKHPMYKSKPNIKYAPMYIIHITKSSIKVPKGIRIIDKPISYEKIIIRIISYI
jgi:hypothetical protein